MDQPVLQICCVMSDYATVRTHQAFTAMAALTPSVETLPFTSRPRFACKCEGILVVVVMFTVLGHSTHYLPSCGYMHSRAPAMRRRALRHLLVACPHLQLHSPLPLPAPHRRSL